MLNAKHLAIIIFLITGTLTYKLQGNQTVSEGEFPKKAFFHPYMQTLTMFIGQALCLVLYFITKSNNHLKSQFKLKLIFIIPAIADFFSSMLLYISLNFIPSSTYMLLRGGTIVPTILFSRCLFSMEIGKRHIIGSLLVIIGMVIVGYSGFVNDSPDYLNKFIGCSLVIVSQIFGGFYYAYQHKIFRIYNKNINVLEMVGYQGIYGMCFTTVLISIFSFSPCYFGKDGCVFKDMSAYWERPEVYLREVLDSWLMILLVISGIILNGFFNFFGLKIIKYYGGLARSILSVARSIFVWILGIIITIFTNEDQFNLQPTQWLVIAIKTLGFIFTIIGTLIYYKIIFPDFLQNKYPGQYQEHSDSCHKHMLQTKLGTQINK